MGILGAWTTARVAANVTAQVVSISYYATFPITGTEAVRA